MQLTELTHFHLQATRIPAKRGTGKQNDSSSAGPGHEARPKLGRAFASAVILMLFNVVGGTLLLSGMFFLPQIIARLLGH